MNVDETNQPLDPKKSYFETASFHGLKYMKRNKDSAMDLYAKSSKFINRILIESSFLFISVYIGLLFV